MCFVNGLYKKKFHEKTVCIRTYLIYVCCLKIVDVVHKTKRGGPRPYVARRPLHIGGEYRPGHALWVRTQQSRVGGVLCRPKAEEIRE